MATLVPFNPLEDAFPEFFKGWPRRFWREQDLQIKIDVTDGEREYKVKAEIPGVKKEDISVQVDGNTVTISAEVKKDEEQKSDRCVCQERYYGSVSRSFTLGSAVDDRVSSAKYADGVLELRLAKREGGNSKRLAIQ